MTEQRARLVCGVVLVLVGLSIFVMMAAGAIRPRPGAERLYWLSWGVNAGLIIGGCVRIGGVIAGRHKGKL
jgi:hypothetical protein